MATEEGIRALLVEQLGVSPELIDHLQMIDVALALGHVLAVDFPVYRLRHLRTYRDVQRAARDALHEQLTREGDFYVRARLKAPDINVVRVGALTPSFAASLADDIRHAPPDAVLDITVPDDFDGAALVLVRSRLAWLLGVIVPVNVRRAGDVGPATPVPWDRMTQGRDPTTIGGCQTLHGASGIAIAFDSEDQPFERRRFPA